MLPLKLFPPPTLRLTLTADTSPLWGAVPKWEAGVGGLFRDVSKRVLCSLNKGTVRYNFAGVPHLAGALHPPPRLSLSPPPAAGGPPDLAGSPPEPTRSVLLPSALYWGLSMACAWRRCLCGIPLGSRGDMLGQAGDHVTPLADGGWLGRSWPRLHGAGRREASGRMEPPRWVPTPARRASGFRGKWGGQGMRGACRGPFVTNGSPSPGACLPDGPPAGPGGAGDRMAVPVPSSPPVGGGLRPGEGLHHGFRWPTGGGGSPQRFRAADVDGGGERLQGVPTTLTILHTAQGETP